MTVKRLGIHVAILLVGGLFTNIGSVVASSFLFDIDDFPAYEQAPRVENWLIMNRTSAGTTRFRVRWLGHSWVQEDLELLELELPDGDWGVLPQAIAVSIQNSSTSEQTFDARGWPFRSMWCELIDPWPRPIQEGVRGGISLDYSEPKLLGGGSGPFALPRSIPLRPIWFGFVANTLFLPLYWRLP